MYRESALIVLHRPSAERPPPGDGTIQVYLVSRSPSLRFFGGYHSFPGGTVDAGDEKLVEVPAGSPEAAPRLAGCAVRELFEEAGLLLAAPARESARMPGADALRECRRILLEPGGAPGRFNQFLEEHGLVKETSGLSALARFKTPAFSSQRFDATFFLCSSAGEPEIAGGELDGGGWFEPAQALEAWRRGALRIAPPALVILRHLSEKPFDAALQAIRSIPAEFEASGGAIPFAPGYDILPLQCPPLPPGIPTNAFFIGGKKFIAIDPGPASGKGREHLRKALAQRLEGGDALQAIVLTHHHPDHSAGALPVAAEFGAPVWAHAAAGRLLGLKLDRELGDGDRISLGDGPDGRPDWTLEALYTPGHSEDHIVLHDPRHKSLIAGDIVSTLVSMYVGSPGGSLRQYFASIDRILGLGLDTLYPSHGTPSHNVRRLLEDTLYHRRQRIEDIFGRLGGEPAGVESIAFQVYPNIDSRLRPLIIRSTRASLEYLEEDGRARCVSPDAYIRT